MKRYLTPALSKFLKLQKFLLIMGPRQVGKTTLSKALDSNAAYYNYDIKKDVSIFLHQEWDRSKKTVIFDELHKMKKWKLWLKGIYDEGLLARQRFVVTGSARLDVARKMGDSLAGRFFSFRLNPLDLKELKGIDLGTTNYKKLIRIGGFPEPFLEGSDIFYNLWRKSHIDQIIRQDLWSLEQVRDIDGIEILTELLSTRVGSTISYNSLSEDLGRDDKTVKRWLTLLERLYVVFRVSPFSKNISRGLKKAGKYYFYDLGRVEGDESRKLENLVALSLKKEIEFHEDTQGIAGSLKFIQTRDHKEIDFVVEQKNRASILFEVKLSDGKVSRNFELLKSAFHQPVCIQLVKNLDREYLSKTRVQVLDAITYLETLNLHDQSCDKP